MFEGERAALVDSGYVSHASQTVALLRHALDGRQLTRLINTHSHSDHIGGNAAVKRAFGCAITIPAGIEPAVREWDEEALMLTPSAQRAERFEHDALLAAGTEIEMGGLAWQALAAPGHDMDALVFYCPQKRILISGDALWEDGFGVVFAELLGDSRGFPAVRQTLEMIGRLPVDVVIPGHGAPFFEVDAALARAFQRLSALEADSQRMARHAIKVMLAFNLMEHRRLLRAGLPQHFRDISLCREINARFLHSEFDELAAWTVRELERAGVLRVEGEWIVATDA